MRSAFTLVELPEASKGFTLVELLVVVTIIVVLLSLLAPAIDRAIYQAELAVCAAAQRGVAQGVTVYAADHKRHYPLREALQVGSYLRSNLIRFKDRADDLSRIRSYVQPGLLLDIFNGGLEPGDFEASDPDTSLYTNYSLYFGWRYKTDGEGRGSNRIGQGFSWGGQTYRALVSDENLLTGWRYLHNGHPGKGGAGSLQVYRDVLGPVPLSATTQRGDTAEKATLSRWNNVNQDAVDLTFAYDDLSVRRVDDVGPEDPRLDRIPFQPDQGQAVLDIGNYTQMLR